MQKGTVQKLHRTFSYWDPRQSWVFILNENLWKYQNRVCMYVCMYLCMFFVQGLFPKDRHRPFSAGWANPRPCWTSRNTNPCQLCETAPFCVPGLQERKINPIAERVSMFPSSHSFPPSSFPPHFHIHSLLAVQTVSVRLLLLLFL